MSSFKIAELKAHLSECLRAVEAGEVVTVYDRSRPIARIVPFEAATPPIDHDAPRARLADFVVPPPVLPVAVGFDVVAELLIERSRDRES